MKSLLENAKTYHLDAREIETTWQEKRATEYLAIVETLKIKEEKARQMGNYQEADRAYAEAETYIYQAANLKIEAANIRH